MTAMTPPLEEPDTAVPATHATTEAHNGAKAEPTSPARSDKSSDSEGKPVRDKLKETRIDAQATSDPVSTADQPMNDAPNGSAPAPDPSASGSDSERGRLRKKRSREDFEEDNDADKHAEKTERHRRKKSRDISRDLEHGRLSKPAPTSVPRIEEHDGDEHMASPDKQKPSVPKDAPLDSTVKNKRTRDQVEEGAAATTDDATSASANAKTTSPAKDERNSKRPKDEVPSATDAAKSQTKIPMGSGFSNTSAASPFAAMSSKPPTSKPADTPTTSDDKFKASAFGSFSTSAASPFGGLANLAPASPFSAASGPKLSSFAGTAAPAPATGGGFAALGSSTKSAFGGSSFGSSLGGGFSSLSGGPPSWGTTGSLSITGLKTKNERAFGAPGDKTEDNADSDDENDDDFDDAERDTTEEERRSGNHLLSQRKFSHPTTHTPTNVPIATETGEEGENSVWTGRAKLYTMDGKGAERSWKERGVGTFKFNVTIDEPKKARFVLRADGTHRLLLNAAVTPQMVFGGDSHGAKPKDVRLLFNSPTADGELEMHLLKMKAENAVRLWEIVTRVQDTEL